MNARRVGLAAAAVGAVVQVVGLGVDAWLHSRDETLAEREGVFSLGNGGHALFIVGLALVMLGMLLAVIGPRMYDRSRLSTGPSLWFARIAAPIVAIGTIVGGVAAGATSSLGQGHETHETADEDHTGHGQAMLAAGMHDHGAVETKAHVVHYMAAARHAQVAVTEDQGQHAELPFPATGPDHGHVAEGPTEPEDPALLDAQLASARAVALAYPTYAAGQAGGYTPVTTYISKIATHLLRLGTVDRVFDPGAPEVLLYAGDAPDSPIVGVAYLTTGFPIAPGFAGNADHWHEHRELCINKESRLIIGVDPNEAACDALGGQFFTGLSLWLLHAWVVPGFESPAGVFSADHPLLP